MKRLNPVEAALWKLLHGFRNSAYGEKSLSSSEYAAILDHGRRVVYSLLNGRGEKCAGTLHQEVYDELARDSVEKVLRTRGPWRGKNGANRTTWFGVVIRSVVIDYIRKKIPERHYVSAGRSLEGASTELAKRGAALAVSRAEDEVLEEHSQLMEKVAGFLRYNKDDELRIFIELLLTRGNGRCRQRYLESGGTRKSYNAIVARLKRQVKAFSKQQKDDDMDGS